MRARPLRRPAGAADPAAASAAGSAPPAWHDIQGNILRPYRHEVTTYLFLTVQDPAAAREWLRELADQVTTADQAADRACPRTAVNLGVTATGLLRLGLPPDRLARLPEAFRQGMAARAERLGDPVEVRDGEVRPSGWHAPFDTLAGVHLLLMVSGDADGVRDRVAEVTEGLWQSGLAECPGRPDGGGTSSSRWQAARMMRELTLADGTVERFPVEHFGYRDGMSQPAVEGVHADAVAGTGRLQDGRWVPLRAGEFILGMVAEDGSVDDAVPSLTRNGSYLVLRRLEQDVAAYQRMVDGAAAATGSSAELARARIMGRWPDGTPLLRSPLAPDADLARRPFGGNDFDYLDDPEGSRCPRGAHVRRANPRGALGFDGRLERRRHLIRRGLPYGPPYVPGAADPDTAADAERGLVFACYQADIAGQFELVQAQWLADGNAFGLGADLDPVVADPGRGSGRMRFEGSAAADGQPARDPALITTAERCVTLRGGDYFLVPGRAALRRLGELPEVPRPRRHVDPTREGS